MRLPKDVDGPCVELCKAINAVPGLKTTSSCCGHGRGPLRIYFTWEHELDLMVLCRANDRRYYQGAEYFIIHAEETDLLERPIVWIVESRRTGWRAYRDAAQLAKNILDAKPRMLAWFKKSGRLPTRRSRRWSKKYCSAGQRCQTVLVRGP